MEVGEGDKEECRASRQPIEWGARKVPDNRVQGVQGVQEGEEVEEVEEVGLAIVHDAWSGADMCAIHPRMLCMVVTLTLVIK